MSNECIKIGTATTNPKFIPTEQGQTFVKFLFESNEIALDGEPVHVSCEVIAWNELGDTVHEIVKVGDELQIDGWETETTILDKNGEFRTRRTITLHHFDNLGELSNEQIERIEQLQVDARRASIARTFDKQIEVGA